MNFDKNSEFEYQEDAAYFFCEADQALNHQVYPLLQDADRSRCRILRMIQTVIVVQFNSQAEVDLAEFMEFVMHCGVSSSFLNDLEIFLQELHQTKIAFHQISALEREILIREIMREE